MDTATQKSQEAATDIDGPGGIHLTGGDTTPPQNAGATLERATDERKGEQRMEKRQLAGAVEQQTQSHNPSLTNPDGLPNPVQGRDVNIDE